MMPPESSLLTRFALLTLEEQAAAARAEPPGRSWAVRLALAYLGQGAADRRPFDDFWALLTDPMAHQASETLRAVCRRGGMHSNLEAIYRAVGVVRTVDMMSRSKHR